jgi:hypothetical protein
VGIADGRPSRLWLVSIGCLVGIVVVALTVASGRFGNRLAGPYGYPKIAVLTVLLSALTAGLPVVIGALVVQTCRDRLPRAGLLYLLGAVGSVVAFVLGTIMAAYLLPALG